MTTTLKARPTVYKGIQMRSRLEAGFAAWLDENGVTWEYEPRAYASDEGQYLPDFEVLDGVRLDGWDGYTRNIFFEVKPREPDLEEQRRNTRIIEACVPGAVLLVVWPDAHGVLAYGYRVARAEWLLPSGIRKTCWSHCYFRWDADWSDHDFIEANGFARQFVRVDSASGLITGPWHGEWWKPGA